MSLQIPFNVITSMPFHILSNGTVLLQSPFKPSFTPPYHGPFILLHCRSVPLSSRTSLYFRGRKSRHTRREPSRFLTRNVLCTHAVSHSLIRPERRSSLM
ncbi:hypothetical protein Y032_0631g859 [Ancylostoma ceylanicum]|uniref:Uncharacterized protein n=1 Tax=Ancylostoma ceylanicum TaxID=53326 RepID=A0A016WJT8_9BILA|nr:hypothetical protein Y032_0631g859 [Ancylostoma ceylanicum]